MTDSPQMPAQGVLRVSIFSNGDVLDDEHQLISASIQRAVNEVPSARLEFLDGRLPDRGFALSDAPTLIPGVTIRINAGYGDEEQTLFEGIVVKHSVRIGNADDVRLVVECRDRAVGMTLEPRSSNYPDRRDSDLIAGLIGDAGLIAEVQPTTVAHTDLVQYGASDWDFVVSRAEANAMLVIATDGKVAVKAPDTSSKPALTVTCGVDILSFEAEIALAQVRGRVSFQGSGKANVGEMIELVGVGKRFSGNAFVGSLRHEISGGDWITEAGIGLPPGVTELRAAMARRPPGLPPGGLQIGKVARLDGDPDGEHRVQVRIPVLGGESRAVWARLLQFYASNGFGALFAPEVDDEVVLGFFDNDPSHPVVLGSLYSSGRTPPHGPEKDNNTKAIVTRGNLRIEFDESQKMVTVSTPANNTIVLSDQDRSILLRDQNGNKVELGPNGITIDAAKDIHARAKGKITIDAVGAISISSQADVKAIGLNVRCEGQIGFTGKGEASAELSASGQTTVRGAMVMIN